MKGVPNSAKISEASEPLVPYGLPPMGCLLYLKLLPAICYTFILIEAQTDWETVLIGRKYLFCIISDKANATIVSSDYDWVWKTLRRCEMYLVWNKQMKIQLIYFTCKSFAALCTLNSRPSSFAPHKSSWLFSHPHLIYAMSLLAKLKVKQQY